MLCNSQDCLVGGMSAIKSLSWSYHFSTPRRLSPSTVLNLFAGSHLREALQHRPHSLTVSWKSKMMPQAPQAQVERMCDKKSKRELGTNDTLRAEIKAEVLQE
jgi:hypothetical protein